MSVVEARVRVHHPCPYCDISVEFPRSLLLLWCDNRRDVFLVSAPDQPELRRVCSALRASFRARCIVRDGNDALVVVPEFEWATPPSVTRLARKTGVWVLHPVVYHGGTETYRFVAALRSELNRLITRIRRLGDVEILSVSSRQGLGTVRDHASASIHFFEGLTDRQMGCLAAAYEGGLFDVPARGRWNDVARQQGLSRSTFGEHLRKGQLRLLANSYPALKARTESPSEPELLPSTGPPKRASRRAPLQGLRTRS